MIPGQVFGGIAVGAWCAGFYVFARWLGSSDRRMRSMAQSRWWLDRRTVRKVRRGEISQEDWFGRFTRQYRSVVKWVFTPFITLVVIVCIATIIHGLIN
jgi:hypothetical protein